MQNCSKLFNSNVSKLKRQNKTEYKPDTAYTCTCAHTYEIRYFSTFPSWHTFFSLWQCYWIKRTAHYFIVCKNLFFVFVFVFVRFSHCKCLYICTCWKQCMSINHSYLWHITVVYTFNLAIFNFVVSGYVSVALNVC